jgi:hypothetical protein
VAAWRAPGAIGHRARPVFPGAALRKALTEGRVRRLSRTTFAPADTGNDDPAGERNQQP